MLLRHFHEVSEYMMVVGLRDPKEVAGESS